MFGAQRGAPGPHAPRPDELDRQARAGVARRTAARVGGDTGGEVLRGAAVERAVAAAQHVDEGQGQSLKRTTAFASTL
jgi:hypothetical protein